MWRKRHGSRGRPMHLLAAATVLLTGTATAQDKASCVPGAACGRPPLKIENGPRELPPDLKLQLDIKVIEAPPPKLAEPDKPVRGKAAVPRHRPTPTPHPPATRNSWDGLPQIGPTRLRPDDLQDVPGQYIVDFNDAALAAAGLDIQSIATDELARRLAIEPTQIRSIQRRFMRTAVLRVTAQQAAALAANPFVASVNPDTKIKAAGGAPPLSWGLDRLDSPSLPLDGRFDRQSGVYEARVYLFDSEVAVATEELETRVTLGARFRTTPSPSVSPCAGHGVEVASLIAGRTTGVAPRAQIVSLVVLPCDREEAGEGASLIEATEWLLLREANLQDTKPVIAHMSLASKWSSPINKAVAKLSANGVSVVAAAGNEEQDACRFSPASAKEAITVGATKPDDSLPGFSNFGECVKIYAPGEKVTVATGNAKAPYSAAAGTSHAAALVTGVLVRSLQRRDPAFASEHLLNAALPARFWRKSDAKAMLAQMSPDWRRYCRIAGQNDGSGLALHRRPGGSVVGALNTDTLVQPVRKSKSWMLVRLARGGTGWITSVDGANWSLLQADGEAGCPQPR